MQLAEVTGLSPAAVTGVTAELIQDGLLFERALGNSSGGRPPILLDINYASHYAVGLKVMENRLEAVLTDLSTSVLHTQSVVLKQHTPTAIAKAAAQITASFLQMAGQSRERLIGVGLGLPGVIDAALGVCRTSPILAWRDVPIAQMIAERVGAPAWVDNDVNALAAAEQLFGRGRQAANFVVITVGRGIGAGLVLRGEVYRGRDGGAGELGHTMVEAGGRRCECGNRGCLEAYASEPALVARYNEQAAKPVRDIHELIARAGAKDELALELLGDAGQRVGRALSGVLNLLNPELIVIGGEGVRLGEAFFTPLRGALLEHAFNGLAEGVPVFVDEWGDDAWARGAASLAVQRAFTAGTL